MNSYEKHIFGQRRFGVTATLWLGVLLFLGFFLVAEFQWNVVENWVGTYLDWHNELRPRIGTAWESFDQTSQAVGKVDTLVSQLRIRESEVESLQNLAEVPNMLSPRGGIAVSKEDFLRLFRGLSPYLWQEWIPAKDLMKLTQEQQWARGYLWWDGSELSIYLVDQNNGVLYRRTIPGDWLEIAALNGQKQSAILEETGEFQRRIYPADRLWQVLDSLDDRIVRQLLSSPGLQATESLHRVGLSNVVVGGLGIVGLEFSTPDGYAVERVVVHDDDLWDLGNILEHGMTIDPSKDIY